MRKVATIVALLVTLLLAPGALPGLAQSPNEAPRRLTFDGHSEPAAWDLAGILVGRPGSVVHDASGVRIGNELWQIDPTSGAARLLSADGALPPREPRAPAGGPTVFVVNGSALEAELWLNPADGTPARLLLRGVREYFDQPAVSPDGSRYAFARTPTGSGTDGTSEIWVGSLRGSAPQRLLQGASLPVWSPNGRSLAVEHAGDVYIVDSIAARRDWAAPAVTLALPAPSQATALTPPPAIRVYHTTGNYNFSQTGTCRDTNLSVGAITTFALEDYVRFVVPIEASPSDPPESLKAQAVASRTYAWACISKAGICTSSHSSYDITDWTGDQAMCDLRADARTDAARSATNGQYVSWNGAVGAALYSANNSDPTATNPTEFSSPGAYPYLRAVDDPVAFGDTRSGHGQGLSQVGAIRWATTFGWDYIQILAHYYSGATIEGATNFGSLIAPGNNLWQRSNRIRIQGNASNGGTFDIFATGSGLATTKVATQSLLAVLDLSAVPDQPLGDLVISDTLAGTPTTALTVGVDRTVPGGTLGGPTATGIPTVTLQLNGTSSGPSGYAGYGLSNNWNWEGEAKKTGGTVSGAGIIVSDAAALNGLALFASSGSGKGVWYGPYAFNLPLGHAYRAYFRLKTNGAASPNEIAKIDVVADGVHPIGIKHLYGTDFRSAGTYQEFSVDFNYVDSPTSGLEFRVDFPGGFDLWLDRVLIATYPAPAPVNPSWTLPSSQSGTYTVIAKFSDQAGNVSPDVARSIVLGLPNRLFAPFVMR